MTRSHTDQRRWFRAAEGPLRAHFRERDDLPRYRRLQRWLDEAAIGTPVDAYLARATRRALGGALLGVLLGAVVAAALAYAGVFVAGPALLGAGVSLVVVGTVLGAGGVWGAYYLYPWVVSYRRGRHTEAMLPHAALFLYALVHGGATLYGVIEDLADAEAVYGDVAVEFDRFVTDIEWLGVDLLTGIDRAAARAPSAELAGFFEELGNVLETGGDAGTFLHSTVETQIDRAESELEQFLDDVRILSEAYIVLVFAGPIFMFVTLTIISFFDPVGLLAMKVLVYGYIPAGVLCYIWLFGHLIGPLQFSLGHVSFDTSGDRVDVLADPGVTDDAGALDRVRRRVRRLTARSPRELLRRLYVRPVVMFAVTVPLALVAVCVVALTGVLPVGVGALFTDPVRAATALVCLPFLVATLPVAVVHEWNRRRVRVIRERFPNALRIVADANRNGVPLAACFETVAERTSPPLGPELARVHHDIQWFNDVDRALKTFADRLGVPTVSRVVYLLTASLRSTHDIAPIVDVVARDLEARNELLDRRHESMQSYVVVVFIGVFVFLVIVALFELSFLPTIQRFAEQGATDLRRTPLRLGDFDILTYRRLLFHAGLIQAVGNGLLLGKMADNDVYSGLKYANVLLVVVVGLFWALL